MKNNNWIRCPVCGNKTRDKIREDTILKNYPLYCPKCKQETLIEVTNNYRPQDLVSGAGIKKDGAESGYQRGRKPADRNTLLCGLRREDALPQKHDKGGRDWRRIPNGEVQHTSAGFNCSTYNSSRKKYKQAQSFSDVICFELSREFQVLCKHKKLT